MKKNEVYFQHAKNIVEIYLRGNYTNNIIEYLINNDNLFNREIELRQKCDNHPNLMRIEGDKILIDKTFVALNILRTIKRKINTFIEYDLEILTKYRKTIGSYNRFYERIKSSFTHKFMVKGNGISNNFGKVITLYNDKILVYNYTLPCKPILFVKTNEIITQLDNGIKARWESPIRNSRFVTPYNYIYFVVMEQHQQIYLHIDELNIRRENKKIVVKGYDMKTAIGHSQPLIDVECFGYNKEINRLIFNKLNRN